ncbi:fatty-acid amide hydrolase 2-B-like isoform X1 [Apis florea]|uniref:fatty-acid amide hydrolase 2-B-like isoform X1 n=1 Tax=Apis florea TaxID=7463 RepID=UPI0006290067|nr:fatty-acid amide hydrolase 2-B-like isoform X1 [Apis florea]
MSLYIKLLIFMMNIISIFIRPILWFMYRKRLPNIPPIKNPLLRLSATTIARKIRNGDLKSETIVKAYIDRIQEVNPFINAVIENRFELAINEAKLYDEQLKSGKFTVHTLEKNKPLYGVPITIKESCCLSEMSYTGGSLLRKGIKALEDGRAVKIIKDAGAIPLLVSNTSELCSGLHSYNFLYGHTLNPYDRRRTSGGSSGGEAALLGAGASVIGLGSDLAGSIRIPSLFCGIFGHKPTAGIVSIAGHLPLIHGNVNYMFVIGPMTRYAEDLNLMMNVLTSKCEKPLRSYDSIELKNLKVFYLDSFPDIKSSSMEITEVVYKASQYLLNKGAIVQRFPKDKLKNILYMTFSLFSELKEFNLLEGRNSILEMGKSIIGLSSFTKTCCLIQMFIDKNAFISISKKQYYINAAKELTREMNDILKDNGVLICPSYFRTASFPQTMLFEINNCIYSSLANITGLPSTHIPMGMDKNGLPIGFQVISAANQDYLCLLIAKEFEQIYGGWISH